MREFQCPCCLCTRVHTRLVDKLEDLREIWKKPLFITSGYRCEKHNQEVGGVPHSLHRKGLAVDVVVFWPEQKVFQECARVVGFDSVITYDKRNFVHLGIR